MKNTQIKNRQEPKMIIITRSDLSNGYQAQQSCHSIADFAYEFPESFKTWKETSNSIICLSVNNENELDTLFHKLSNVTNVTKFYEPDLNDELTSICLFGGEDIRRKLSYLPLLGKSLKQNHSELVLNDS